MGYSISKLLELLKLQSLDYRRILYDLTLCYQIGLLRGYRDTTIIYNFMSPT